MKEMMRRLAALILAALLLCGAACAESEKDGFHFDDKGFLTGDSNPAEEYLLEDEKEGVWRYATKDLSITVTRYRETVKTKGKKLNREYCIADVWASEASPLFSIMMPAKGKKPAGYYKDKPEALVKLNPVMLAISDDYYGHRMQTRGKGSKWPDGIIIRNGELISDKTRKKGQVEFPPLDTLAVYPDGSMSADPVAEKTAEDFQAEGAVQVYAFGPWLIHNGEINTKGVDSSKHYMYNTAQYSDSRAAIGMVEPFHYIAIVVNGRPTKKNIGVKFEWLAEKMLELGCTEALNLDGGGTACMVFNGKEIIQGEPTVRALGSMIAFGPKEE
jgi:exopolysaccharide biosynthesis protein